ncbi:hypothetical protein OG618_08185 [Kitasatospora sp. NBC_01246]|uniref:hypothetical protein n=1 Tax=Kitasatospora sp. NBC_01246 TaxID=2903570 RepID=UPI002E33430D|nr:hypothetical protein [Kitasatospora sp. NBC_01246]
MNYGYLVPVPPGLYANEKELAESVLSMLEPHFHIDTEVPGRYWTGEKVRIDAVLRPHDPEPWFDENPTFGIEFKLPPDDFETRTFAEWIAQAVDYSHCTFEEYGRLAVFLCPSPFNSLMAALSDHHERLATTNTFEYQRRLAATLWSIGGRPEPTEEQINAEARARQRQEHRRLETIEAGAKAEGFKSADDRSRKAWLDKAAFMAHIMGQLNIGELMPHQMYGWTLLRTGQRLWSELDGVARRMGSVRPHLGSR